MSASFEYFVPGVPVPQGSKRIFANPHTKRPMLVEAGGHKWARWRKSLSAHALHASGTRGVIVGPVLIHLVFAMERPAGQLRTIGGHLTLSPKASAPPHPCVKPDFDKLTRAVCDSMKGILIEDDSRVVMATVDKIYDAAGGVYVSVRPAPLYRPETRALVTQLGGYTWKTASSASE